MRRLIAVLSDEPKSWAENQGPKIVAAPVSRPAPLGTSNFDVVYVFKRGGVGESLSLQASPTVSRIEAVNASAGVLPAHTTY